MISAILTVIAYIIMIPVAILGFFLIIIFGLISMLDQDSK